MLPGTTPRPSGRRAASADSERQRIARYQAARELAATQPTVRGKKKPAILNLAIMAVGGVTVPAYTTNTPDDHAHILTDSGARLAIVSTPALAARLLPAVARMPEFQAVIAIEAVVQAELSCPLHRWGDLLAQDAGNGDAKASAATLERGDTACIIYTSGTGGRRRAP